MYNGTAIYVVPNNKGDRNAGIYIQRSYGGIGMQLDTESIPSFNGKQAQIILEYTKKTD